MCRDSTNSRKKTTWIGNTFIRTAPRVHKILDLRLSPAIKNFHQLYRAYLQFSPLKFMQSNSQLVWPWKVMQPNPLFSRTLEAFYGQSFENPPKNYRKLKHAIYDAGKRGKQIELCWISGHASLSGNKKKRYVS